MSVVLTVVSLGTRVALAYALSAHPRLGGWRASGGSVPIGWFLADMTGLILTTGARKQRLFALPGRAG